MSQVLTLHGTILEIALEGELPVVDVKEMHAAILAALSPEHVVVVRAKDVSRVDTAVAQLIYAVGVYARSFEVLEASEAWLKAFRLLGLERPIDPEPGT